MRFPAKPLATAVLAATLTLAAAGCGSAHKATNTPGSGGSGGTSVSTPGTVSTPTTAGSSGYGY